ncbi:MAG: C4-dicarboxylate ABC transporter, partial [Alphaproteobacteria bacterium]
FGTPAAYTGPMIFKRLHIGAINSFIPNPVAVGKMRKGIDSNIAAVVFVSSKPLTPFLRSWPKGFHFLRVPYDKVLKDYYLPSMLTHEDYPELIPEGKRVLTVSVPAVLAAFNWEHNADRYRRMGRFVRYFFKRLHILQTKPGYHPKWKNVNLGANVPGWNRCPTATEILKQKKEIKPSVTEEELLQEFLRWRKSRGK